MWEQRSRIRHLGYKVFSLGPGKCVRIKPFTTVYPLRNLVCGSYNLPICWSEKKSRYFGKEDSGRSEYKKKRRPEALVMLCQRMKQGNCKSGMEALGDWLYSLTTEKSSQIHREMIY